MLEAGLDGIERGLEAPDPVREKFVEAKRAEYDDYKVEVSEWELDRYLETF